jgi:hypothetical protein
MGNTVSVIESFSEVILYNLVHNPLLANFKCMLERRQKSGVPVLGLEVLGWIMSRAQARGLSNYATMERHVNEQVMTVVNVESAPLSHRGSGS